MSETDKSVGRDDLNKMLLESMERGLGAAGEHRYGNGEDTKKFFGFEVDGAIGNMLEVGYNTLIGGLTRRLKTHTYGTIERYAKPHLSTPALHRTAAGASFAVNLGVFAMPTLTEAYQLWGKQRDSKQDMVAKLAPLLDELEGRHGMAAYNRSKNPMIAYDRWRRAKLDHAKLTNLVLPGVVKVAPNIWMHERDSLAALQQGKHIDEVHSERIFGQVAKQRKEEIAELYNAHHPEKPITDSEVSHTHVKALNDANIRGAKNLINEVERAEKQKRESDEGLSFNGFAGNLSANSLLTLVANKWVQSSNHRLKKQFTTEYTALEMVMALREQLGNEPKPHSFELPQSHRSLPLESYIAEIMMQHQRDMATMSADHALIRDALHENVLAAAKPLAEALRKGDISALSLVEYIGSGKIIRNKGRMIAGADEVEAMIEHEKARGTSKPAVTNCKVDPKDFWADASYTEKEAREAFVALQGEERKLAISLVPKALWKSFGISEKEGNAVTADMAKEIHDRLAEALLGVNELDDETLRHEGLAKSEIRKIRDAAARVKENGVEAVAELISNELHPNGVDRDLLGVVVGSAVKGEKLHLGTLVKQGREQLNAAQDQPGAEVEADMDEDAPPAHRPEHQGSHAKRIDHRRREAANHGARHDVA